MSRQRRTLFVALAVAAIAVWGYNIRLIFNPGGDREPVAAAPSPRQAGPGTVWAYPGDTPDPFFCKAFMAEVSLGPKARAARKKPVHLPQCAITGIVYNASNPMAMIRYDGKSVMVKKGDVLGEMTIQKVEKDTVRIFYKGKILAVGK